MSINIFDVWFAKLDISNNIKLKLLKKYNASSLFYFNKKELMEILNYQIREQTVNKILDSNYRKKLNKYCEYLENNKISLISYKNENYPNKLRFISDKPAYLFRRRKFVNNW